MADEGTFVFDSEETRARLAAEPHARGEVEFLQSLAREGMIAVEAGGHTGLTAVAIAKAIGPTGHLYTFEPVPAYYERLQRNLALNSADNVTAINAVLAERSSHVHVYVQGGGSGLVQGETPEDEVDAEAISLDDFMRREALPRLDLLHMDCEASELLVLRGGRETLERWHPQIFSEIHHGTLARLGQSIADIAEFLESLGYRVRPLVIEDMDAEITLDRCSHIYAWAEEH